MLRWITALAMGVLLPLSAQAAVADFTGTLTVFWGTGSGTLSSDSYATSGTASWLAAGSSVSFGLSASEFFVDGGGFERTINTGTPNLVYQIGSVVNTSTSAGSFSGSPGSFGGTMSTGLVWTLSLGLTPLPGVLATITVPVNAGSPGTQTAMASLLGLPITATGFANAWSTGSITADDSGLGTTGVQTAFTVTGSHALTPGGGSVSLVTPFLLAVHGDITGHRAGYARLDLAFTVMPEPGTALLLASGVAALVAAGRVLGGRR